MTVAATPSTGIADVALFVSVFAATVWRGALAKGAERAAGRGGVVAGGAGFDATCGAGAGLFTTVPETIGVDAPRLVAPGGTARFAAGAP